MPTSVEAAPRWAVDTSVAIAYLDAAHSAHRVCVEALSGVTAALAGHAAFESFSVLTRSPGPTSVTPSDAAVALRAAFPDPCWLEPRQHAALLELLGASGIHGGMVYDALVGEAARVNERTLLTRDRRAAATYSFLGVPHQLLY